MSRAVLLVSASTFANGCLVMSGSVDFVRTDEQRARIRFENVEAWKTFYKSVGKVESKEEESSIFFIPFLVGVTHRKDYSFNAVFNDQAAIADIDGDGEITEGEAKEHAEYVRQKHEQE